MHWANFLHIYQPPTQTEHIVRKVTSESYRTLVRVLDDSPKAKITLNINACLTEQLASYGLADVIEGLRRSAERGQIEFTASAVYHPILPLIPRDEAIRQIRLNTETNRRYFGDAYDPKGFFPPEMCYSTNLARLVREVGFRWIIVDEIAFNGRIGSVRDDRVYSIKEAGDLVVFFKERPFSTGITYGKYPERRQFLEALGDKLRKNSYLLTGTDGEIYGHHRSGQEKLLQEMWALEQPGTCFISDLLDLYPREQCHPLASSWSTWEDEMARGIPYPQWEYPGHELHALQWRFTRLAIDLVKTASKHAPDYDKARHLLDEGLHSCQYWWASCRPWWNTAMVEAGARRLFDAVVVLKPAIPPERFEEASDILNSIIETARRWQDSGLARRRKEDYLRNHRDISSELAFGE